MSEAVARYKLDLNIQLVNSPTFGTGTVILQNNITKRGELAF